MRTRTAQLSLFLVALLIGLLLVGQLRSQARPQELSSQTAQELSELIDTLSARNDELRRGLSELRDQVRDYRLTGEQGQSAVALTREDLTRISAFGGLLPVEGQGIVLDIQGEFDPAALNDLINELRNGGAEAIAVDDVRITARSVAVLGAESIEIDGVAIGQRFEVAAIGDPEGLLNTLQRPGGIMSQLALVVSATIDAEQRRDLRLPATAVDLTPRVGTAVQ
jgi:uncharacterized protein YlxW (UPF0749 family)